MSALGLLYDIHGNLVALEAVLADARSAGVARFLLGGDYALFGGAPAETLATLRDLEDATWIRGNVDRWCAFPDQAGDDELLQRAIADCRSAIGGDTAAELGALPEQARLDGLLFCHASPASDLESFLPAPGPDDERLLAGVTEGQVVFGHTHLQFHRAYNGEIELINPGSVGMPLDGDPRAAYAIVFDGAALEQRRVAYDHEAAGEVLTQRFGDAPWAVRSRRRLREARP